VRGLGAVGVRMEQAAQVAIAQACGGELTA
jgi:hypothetical protein